jgi:hypothetical protein
VGGSESTRASRIAGESSRYAPLAIATPWLLPAGIALGQWLLVLGIVGLCGECWADLAEWEGDMSLVMWHAPWYLLIIPPSLPLCGGGHANQGCPMRAV